MEDFINEIVFQLKHIAGDIETNPSHVDLRSKVEFFKNLRHFVGNTGMFLSGGGSLGKTAFFVYSPLIIIGQEFTISELSEPLWKMACFQE